MKIVEMEEVPDAALGNQEVIYEGERVETTAMTPVLISSYYNSNMWYAVICHRAIGSVIIS